MAGSFPTEHYLEALMHLFNSVKHKDLDHTRAEHIHTLNHVYSKAATHLMQPSQLKLTKMPLKKLQAPLETIVFAIVCSWPRLPPDVMVDLSIHYTYMLMLDDNLNTDTDKPDVWMQTFFGDLVAGRPQRHPWWQLINGQMPTLLQHYGPLCAFNIVRSVIDFFQGCWIEQYDFLGFPGSHEYPKYLRRLNGVGQSFSAVMFPKALFDEQKLFIEITAAIAEMQKWMPYANDLMSFYKEFNDPKDQSGLIRNYCHCEGITIEDALHRLTRETIALSKQILAIFEDKEPRILATIQATMHGWITWHLCSPRYRLEELAAHAGGSEVGVRFGAYLQAAREIYATRPDEWAVPTLAKLAEQTAKD